MGTGRMGDTEGVECACMERGRMCVYGKDGVCVHGERMDVYREKGWTVHAWGEDVLYGRVE